MFVGGLLAICVLILFLRSVRSTLVTALAIPISAMNLLYRKSGLKKKDKPGVVNRAGGFFVSLIVAISNLFQKNILTRLACVICFTALSLVMVWILIPKAEYLPQGNQNIIMNILVPPPGDSAAKRHEVETYIYDQLAPYMKEDGRDGFPRIKDTFYVAADMINMFGVTCIDERETEVRKLMPLMNRIIASIPGMFGVSIQPGIFESEMGKGRPDGGYQIDHLEKKRNIRLEMTPPATLALQSAMEAIEGLVSQMDTSGRLQGVQVNIGGNADKLTQTYQALQWNFLLPLSRVFTLFVIPALLAFFIGFEKQRLGPYRRKLEDF